MWNVSQAFRNELRNPNQQIAAKASLLDSSFHEIPYGDFFTPGADDFQDYIVDGNVDIDRDRGTRRTGQVTILNKDGQFSPDGSSTDYDGNFYVNRNVRLFRGMVVAGGTTIYAPIGTFMIDSIDVLVERNMSVMNLTMSDHWKKFDKSICVRTKTYPVGTHVNTIINEQAAAAGANFPLAPSIDTLTGTWRTSANTTLQSKRTIERGDSRGDFLKSLAASFAIDIFFNQEGRLTTNDRRDPKDASEVWHFYTSSLNQPLGMLNSVRKTISDDGFYNHVFVIGLGNETAPVIYEVKNTDPMSLGNIQRLGDRVKLLESQTWKTQSQVDEAGKKLWAARYNLSEEIVIDTICNPALDADDMLRITETTSKINGFYRIINLNVPLTTSKQTIRAARNVVWY
jgi:hypothetical protein